MSSVEFINKLFKQVPNLESQRDIQFLMFGKFKKMDKPFIRGTTKTWKTLVFCIVWQYHNFSVILEDPPISGVHSDKRWKPSHNELRVGPRLQQSTYQKREVGGIWIQSDWWALQSTTAKTLKTYILKKDIDMLRCTVVCQLKKFYGLCQGTI